jgi:hypothetical protein
LGILFWVVFCASFPFVLFYLIRRELPRLFPLHRNVWFSLLLFIVAIVLFILTHRLARSLICNAALICLVIAIVGFLPRLPRRLIPWRDLLFTFLLGIALFSPILAAGIPLGPDVWAKPYLARSAAASIATVTEPGWDIGWMLGFDYTVYGAFSPVMSGLFALISGDHFAGVRLEMFTAFLFLPPLAYLVGRRVGRNRWGGFVTLIVLVSARMALGYIGISRFWAVALLLALWLALSGWRTGKRGYAPLVAFLLSAAIFVHTQVGLMALLLFSGFSLEMLYRRCKGLFTSWAGIILGMVGLTAIWWYNILESSPVIYFAPDSVPLAPGILDRSWELTIIFARQFIDPFIALAQLPDIYSHGWYLGALTVVLGALGLVLWRRSKCRRPGIFPALWAGGLALLVNLPLLYSIPILGDFAQNLVFPSFSGESYTDASVGLQQRYLLLCWLSLGIVASRIPSFISQIKQPRIKSLFIQSTLVVMTFLIVENQPFWLSYLKSYVDYNPRKDNNIWQVEEFFKQQPSTEKVLYDLPIDYGGILESSLNSVPLLQGWIAIGYNYNFAFNYLWPLQVAVEEDPPKTTRMLAAVGVLHFIMQDDINKRKLAAMMRGISTSVHGTWLFAEIPTQFGYLNPGRLIRINDKHQIDYDGWNETPWKVYSLGDECCLTDEDNTPPNLALRELSLRKEPNRVEITYGVDQAGVVVCNLAYQPALRATLDGKPIAIAENQVNGLVWFESPAGEHRLCLFRTRSTMGWLALVSGLLVLCFCLVLIFLQNSNRKSNPKGITKRHNY